MKILFINISDIKGGSSIIAYNLNKYLEDKYRTRNLLLVRDKFTTDANVIQTRKNKFEKRVEWGTNIFFNAIGLQYKFLPFSPGRILKAAREFKPDVINLHNPIGGYFKTSDLVALSEVAPVVWTLHDMWPMTGNAAHTFGNEEWKNLKSGPGENKIYPWIGINTGTRLLQQKKNIYAKSGIRIIVPSNWMYKNAKESPVFKGKKIDMIHHGIDLKFFKPIDKNIAKAQLKISADQKVITYSAEKLRKNQFKGGRELEDIISRLDRQTSEKVLFLGIGEGRLPIKNNLKNIEVRNLGYISDQKTLISYYSASDIFVYPTKADSFGLVLLEAIACGTPCITFNIGGCSDIIREGISGNLIKPFDTSDFADQINLLLSDDSLLKNLSISCRKYAEDKFDLSLMADKYYAIFKEETKTS